MERTQQIEAAERRLEMRRLCPGFLLCFAEGRRTLRASLQQGHHLRRPLKDTTLPVPSRRFTYRRDGALQSVLPNKLDFAPHTPTWLRRHRRKLSIHANHGGSHAARYQIIAHPSSTSLALPVYPLLIHLKRANQKCMALTAKGNGSGVTSQYVSARGECYVLTRASCRVSGLVAILAVAVCARSEPVGGSASPHCPRATPLASSDRLGLLPQAALDDSVRSRRT
ncbi:hypothetical protein BC628DRAFT_1187003 [Trametes gibbosa]|nr:hypothetical protein BC628DRAFT_1187003 [Trametes gibbosa]